MASTPGGNQPTIRDYPDLLVNPKVIGRPGYINEPGFEPPSPGDFTSPGPTGAIDPIWGHSDVPGLMPYMPYPTYDTALDPWHAPYPPGYPQWPTPDGAVNPQPLPNMPFAPIPPGGIPGWNPPFDNIPAQPEPTPKKIDLFKGLFPNKGGASLPMPTSPLAAAQQFLGTPPGFNALYDLGPFPIRNIGTSMGYQ